MEEIKNEVQNENVSEVKEEIKKQIEDLFSAGSCNDDETKEISDGITDMIIESFNDSIYCKDLNAFT